MLTYLSIKNFALIENCEIEFGKGLNIITGETGAGKSIVILALSILLGGRATVENIRTGMEEAVINGTIDISKSEEVKKFLDSIGILYENDEILIRRVLTSSGKSRSFINGTPVMSKELETISSILFDFHGQHEGISLLKKQTHLGYLDRYANLENDLKEIKDIYTQLKDIEESLRSLEINEKDKEKKIELLTYEIEEIESANIKDREDIELLEKIKIAENIEKIINNCEEFRNLFKGENGILNKLRIAKNLSSQLSEMDNSLNQKSEEIADIYYRIEDIVEEFNNISRKYQYEPDQLDKLNERHVLIEKLKRKYGGSIESIKKYLIDAKKELNLINFSSEKKEELLKKLKETKERYIKKAMDISKNRKEAALILENKVKEVLIKLGMEKVDFKINFTIEENENGIECQNKKIRFFENGIDIVEFLISPNKGEPLKSLIKIASGGELSRIILALKSVLCKSDTVETMIFDEIDVGIGGKVAISVSKELKNISQFKQIICITHLAQIAANSDNHFFINKKVVNERTVTSIVKLDDESKIKEIARMLSGNVTDLSQLHAKELINSL
ncbi:MAG TPA: DNA repair protein RecN, partial [Spirochaetota bacterium]|nr:DNA repair protein RecN [Spirochaetota bacterium]